MFSRIVHHLLNVTEGSNTTNLIFRFNWRLWNNLGFVAAAVIAVLVSHRSPLAVESMIAKISLF